MVGYFIFTLPFRSLFAFIYIYTESSFRWRNHKNQSRKLKTKLYQFRFLGSLDEHSQLICEKT